VGETSSMRQSEVNPTERIRVGEPKSVAFHTPRKSVFPPGSRCRKRGSVEPTTIHSFRKIVCHEERLHRRTDKES
jgi:hypothetical protein